MDCSTRIEVCPECGREYKLPSNQGLATCICQLNGDAKWLGQYAKKHTAKELKLVADTICFMLNNPERAELLMGYIRNTKR